MKALFALCVGLILINTASASLIERPTDTPRPFERDMARKRGLVCTSPTLVERFIKLGEKRGIKRALRTVNAEAHDESACAMRDIRYTAEKNWIANTVRMPSGNYLIVRITVTGYYYEEAFFSSPHTELYTFF